MTQQDGSTPARRDDATTIDAGGPPSDTSDYYLEEEPPQPPPWVWPLVRRSLWRVIYVVVVALAAFWALGELTSLITILVMAAFFGMAMEPAVSGLSKRFGWRRGLSTGLVMLGVFVAITLLFVVLIPALATMAETLGAKLPDWAVSVQKWLADSFGITVGGDPPIAEETADDLQQALSDWAKNAFGTVVSVATGAIGLVFNFFTMLLFMFYFAADGPKLRRAMLRRVPPNHQERLGWALDTAIKQTGAYFYVRILLMVINGSGFFFTMVLVGVPTALSLALGAFAGFVAAFIPTIGTYIASAIPILVTLGLQGLTAALILLGYVLIYQAVENYWLSPRLSAKTMEINAAVAFGAAMAGGALFGPVGMFISLPAAGLITSFVSHYAKRYPIVYQSGSNATAVELEAAPSSAPGDRPDKA